MSLFDSTFDGLIFVGGPARSGTTLLAKLLNQHPRIVAAIDNNVFESWPIYDYKNRTGLVRELREREMTEQEVKSYFCDKFIKGRYVCGIAASQKVEQYPLAHPRFRRKPWKRGGFCVDLARWYVWRTRRRVRNILYHLSFKRPALVRKGLRRCCVPLELFDSEFRVCFKSPEIVFVLEELAGLLPKAVFVLTHRPIIEIAESMYRKAFVWNSYHRRWSRELDENGESIPEAGVPEDWFDLWRKATDFQRCVIYAASFFRAMADNIPKIASSRVFIYGHKELQGNSAGILKGLSEFLGVDFAGFQNNMDMIRKDIHPIGEQFKSEYAAIKSKLDAESWMSQVAGFDYAQ